jgi:uncharacterized protein YgiB involved in biofilm formation
LARKSSRSITLVLVGVAALAGCSEDKRDMYATRDDCLADWGNKPEDCVPATPARSGGVYYGPSYRVPWWRGWHGGSAGTRSHALSSVASHGASRGGFGSSAHASSGG